MRLNRFQEEKTPLHTWSLSRSMQGSDHAEHNKEFRGTGGNSLMFRSHQTQASASIEQKIPEENVHPFY
jgi:hypothetical protein